MAVFMNKQPVRNITFHAGRILFFVDFESFGNKNEKSQGHAGTVFPLSDHRSVIKKMFFLKINDKQKKSDKSLEESPGTLKKYIKDLFHDLHTIAEFLFVQQKK